jgi:hypothetical protein
MRSMMPWLTEPDIPLLRTWIELEYMASALFNRLADNGAFDEAGNPRNALLNHHRVYRQLQVKIGERLGLIPTSPKGVPVQDAGLTAVLEQLSKHGPQA